MTYNKQGYLRVEWEKNDKLSTRFFYNTVDSIGEYYGYFLLVVELKGLKFSLPGLYSDPASGEVIELAQCCGVGYHSGLLFATQTNSG